MPPTSIFPFIYSFVMTFSMLAMIARPALVGFLFNSRDEAQPLPLVPIGLLGWACRPEIAVIQTFCNAANAMGHVHFEVGDGTKSNVDKTFGYVFGEAGDFRIIIHQPLHWILMHSVGVKWESLWLKNGSIFLSDARIGLMASASNWIPEARD